MKLIAQGAEAKIYDDGNIIKDRIAKTYRLKAIDDKLRKARTNREAKVLKKLSEMDFPCPKLIRKEDFKITMENLDGPKLRDCLEIKHCKELGTLIKNLHNQNIIHGDLTTSNMILKDKIYLIDFGLSFFSQKVEDKAVDLHLLEEALHSKHYLIAEECFKLVLEGYCDKEVISRLNIVKNRGRNKTKVIY